MNEQVKLNKRVISQTCADADCKYCQKNSMFVETTAFQSRHFLFRHILYQNIPIHSLMKWS